MKKQILLSFILAGLTASGIHAQSNVPRTNYKFDANSVLSEGKWVRIAVPETGVYELSYDQLRQMGFSRPENVTVFGRGGSAFQINFTDSSNSETYYQDNPSQLHVLHSNNKVIFYGIGPEDMSVDKVGTGNTERLTFKADARNIYSDKSYYLLTDSRSQINVPVRKIEDKGSALEKTVGFSYYYYEKDVTQGGGGTSQSFWGPALSKDNVLKFPISYPYAVDYPSYLYLRQAVGSGSGGGFDLKFNNYTRTGISLTVYSTMFKVTKVDYEELRFKVDENNIGTGTLELKMNNAFTNGRLLALDWFTFTCPMSPALAAADANFSQQYMAFPCISSQKWKYAVPADAVVWDVTKRQNPIALEVSDGYAYNSASSYSETVVFRPSAPLKQITEWYEMANQNLHALQTEGADLLIISTDTFREYAESIAELHREYDGIKVLVTSPQELYNEFSNGTPDPMSYRAFAKLLYQSPGTQLKNILILGPMNADFRNVANNENPLDSHIAYMANNDDINVHSLMVIDYFGVVSDFISNSRKIQTAPISVGVGLLPVKTLEEGALVVSKIREYITTEDFSNIVNETMGIAHDNDNNLHEYQTASFAETLQARVSTFDTKLSHHLIEYAKLSNQSIRNQFNAGLDRGKLITYYYGHAMNMGLGHEAAIIGLNELISAKNKELGIMMIAGCNLLDPVKRKISFGDAAVTRAPRGFIATLSAMGEVMSNDNDSLMKAFHKGLYLDRNHKLRTSTPTLGEAYSFAKDNQTSDSEVAYVLIGDPALRLPVVLGKVNVSLSGSNYHPGDIMKVSGEVLAADGSVNTGYNGYVTVKLMEPARTIVTPVLKPKPNKTDPDQYYQSDMTDFRLATVKGTVTNGRFEVLISIPETASAFLSTEGGASSLPVMVATYDPASRLGCSGIAQAVMALDGSEDSDALRDTKAPEITLSHDALMQQLTIIVDDDVAFYPGIGAGSGISASLDGFDYNVESSESNDVSVNNYSVRLSTAHLDNGEHNLIVSASDLSGNTNSKTLKFIVNSPVQMHLQASDELVIDEISFRISGNVPGEELTLIMTDPDGNIVYSCNTAATELSCDLSDIAPGVYRAALRHNSAKGARLYSNWVQFTVID